MILNIYFLNILSSQNKFISMTKLVNGKMYLFLEYLTD